jgi:hypothetical protein
MLENRTEHNRSEISEKTKANQQLEKQESSSMKNKTNNKMELK